MSVLIDTSSCLLCVLVSVGANVFANEIGSEPVICGCKQKHTDRGREREIERERERGADDV